MARDGIPFLLLFTIPALVAGGAAAVFGLWFLWGFAATCALLAAFMAYFFRNPERTPPGRTLRMRPSLRTTVSCGPGFLRLMRPPSQPVVSGEQY